MEAEPAECLIMPSLLPTCTKESRNNPNLQKKEIIFRNVIIAQCAFCHVCPESLKGLLWTNSLSILTVISSNICLALESVMIVKVYL